MKLQATGMLVRSTGSFLPTALSMPLLMAVSARALISLAGLFSLAAAAAALYVPEPTDWGHLHLQASLPSSSSSTSTDSSGNLSCCGGGCGAVVSLSRLRGSALRAVDALRPCFTRQMGCAAAFLFAYRLMPTALVTFTTFTYAQFTLPNWAYSGLLPVSMGMGIVATYAHRALSGCLSLPLSFAAGGLANAVCGLGRLGVVYAWSGEEGKVGAPVAALISSNLLSSFGMMFGYMPILALAAQSAPPGLEAFGFSMMIFIADLGTFCGSVLAAELTEVRARATWNQADPYK